MNFKDKFECFEEVSHSYNFYVMNKYECAKNFPVYSNCSNEFLYFYKYVNKILRYTIIALTLTKY